MSAGLDHTIVHVRDRRAAAEHLVAVLGLRPAAAYGPFALVRLDNGSTICLADSIGQPQAVHLAFLVDEASFAAVAERLSARAITTWADPSHEVEGVDEERDEGGRGLYWDDPDGNTLEILTVPDGGWWEGHPRDGAGAS